MESIKNILIALFGIIAILIAALTFNENTSNSLSPSHQAAVLSILKRDNIDFQGQMPLNHAPIRQLEMRRYDYDLEALATRFFGNTQFNRYYDIADHIIFESHDFSKIMEYSHWLNAIRFEIYPGISNQAFTNNPSQEAAEELATYYIQSLIGIPSTMQLFPTVQSHQGGWVVSFFTIYRGYVLHNDHIRVYITQNGIEEIMYSRVHNYSFTGDPVAIISPDKALIALTNHLRQSGVMGNVIISEMHLSYYLSTNEHSSMGIPVYIFEIYTDENIRFTFIFNAQTNSFIDYTRLW